MITYERYSDEWVELQIKEKNDLWSLRDQSFSCVLLQDGSGYLIEDSQLYLLKDSRIPA